MKIYKEKKLAITVPNYVEEARKAKGCFFQVYKTPQLKSLAERTFEETFLDESVGRLELPENEIDEKIYEMANCLRNEKVALLVTYGSTPEEVIKKEKQKILKEMRKFHWP